jgi:hypothetical protein
VKRTLLFVGAKPADFVSPFLGLNHHPSARLPDNFVMSTVNVRASGR